MPDAERFLGSVRRECLDHFLIFQEKHLSRLLTASIVSFNQARPHQGRRIPDPPARSAPQLGQPNQIIAVPVLGGLHHDSQRTAYYAGKRMLSRTQETDRRNAIVLSI